MTVAPAVLARHSTPTPPSGPDAEQRTERGAAPQLRVLGPPRHTRRYIIAALVAAAFGIFGIVSLNALAAEAAFEARSLENEVTELSLRHNELTAEVAALSAPGRVRRVAQEELGMVAGAEAGFLFADELAGEGRVAGSPDPLAVAQAEDASGAPGDERAFAHALGER